MDFVVSKNFPRVKELAEIALAYQLYHDPVWLLKRDLSIVKDGDIISIAIVNNVPIGVALAIKKEPSDSYDIQVFVKPDHRRKKYGSELLKKIKQETTCKKLNGYYGAPGSRDFYEKQAGIIFSGYTGW